MNDYDNIRNALTYIDPHDRDTWLRMGAAIKDELGEDGFELWNEWSRQDDTYRTQDAKAVWKSLKQGYVHIGTLFYHARENGYRPEKPYTPPSPEELAQRAEKAQERQRVEAERVAQSHAKAAKTAYGIWRNANPADLSHAYAQSKGLGKAAMSVIRQNEYQGKKQLIIPLYADKKLVNVQTIDEQGNKSFLSGGQKQGAYTIIGNFKNNQNGIVLAEGFATAASVHQATGRPVVVAFDAGNLKAVSEKLINVLPTHTPIYFAADNDPNQTGLKKAQVAAEIWGNRAQIMLPEFSNEQIQQFKQIHGSDKMPTDFNDLHQLAGIEAVAKHMGVEKMALNSEKAQRTMLNVPYEDRQIAKANGARWDSVDKYWYMPQGKEVPEILKKYLPEAQPKQHQNQHNEQQIETTQEVGLQRQPELSQEQRLQNNYWRMQNGYDPLPEASHSKLPENQQPQEIRTPWGDFPPVISNGKLGDLKNEPEYSAAKAGDVEQSALLVEKLLKDETVDKIKQLIGDTKPILVPIQSEEASGKNRIPHTTARALAEKLNLPVDTNIVQSNTAKRTDSGIYQRYVSPPEFKGEVKAGQSYLIIDDTLSVGGTIAALKGYIENNGGKAIGSMVMTAHELKVDIAIKPDMLQSLERKQGLNEYWRQEFGYSVDKLTQQEAGHLRKPTLEQIQERVQEARQTLNMQKYEELHHESTKTQSTETEQRPVHTTSEIDGRASGRVETVRQGSRQISQSLLQQEQTTESAKVNNSTHQTATSNQDVAVAYSQAEMEHTMQNQANSSTQIPTYSHDNPYAQWASHDDEIRQNADDWEARQPLTDGRLAEFNAIAEQQGFTTHIEPQHGHLGVFQADKYANNMDYRVDIIGEFKNHGSQSIYEAPRDFTVSFYEKENAINYFYTNDLNMALQQANEWLKSHELQQSSPTPTATSNQDVADLLKKEIKDNDMATSSPHLEKIILNWTEQNNDKNVEFKNLDELQQWFEKSYSTRDIPEYGYSKSNFSFIINEEKESHQIDIRTDVSIHNFNPHTEHIKEHLREWIEQHPLLQKTDLNPTTATSQDVADFIPTNHEMHNSIEYDGLNQEVDTKPVSDIKQPETSANLDKNGTKVEAQQSTEHHQQKTQANTSLTYQIPEHLEHRVVAVDTQRFRVGSYEMGSHLLRYTAPDNPKTVLFEDKGKSLHTAKNDQQTIQDMLAIAQAKNWDSIKISGDKEFKQKMWLEAESRGIATKGYKPSPEDLAVLEKLRHERSTNSIAEAEKLKQQSAVPEHANSTHKTIPTEAVKAAETVKTHATQSQHSTSSQEAKSHYESKLTMLPPDQQTKARFYEQQALIAMRYMPAEFHEKTLQAIYENQADLIHDGQYHAPDPMVSRSNQQEADYEKTQQIGNHDSDLEMER